ncbi:MAG: site-specific integrase [Bacteroides sp.]|nr:site-specific integrase [Bacteroides sp.]
MASIVKRGKSYSVVYYKKTEKGKKSEQVWESGLSYTAARTRKAQIEHELAQELKNSSPRPDNESTLSSMTVSEFLYEFVEKYGEKRWGASSYVANLGLIENYIHPYFGENKLRSVKVKTVDDYYHFLETEAEPATNMGRPTRDHVSASTIHDIHKLLRCAFNLAVRWEYINKNPFLYATLPEHKEKERETLSPEQVLKVLDFTCRPDNYDYFMIHCAVLIAIGCTFRGGEIAGLQWDRVDFEKKTFCMDRVIDRISKDSIRKLSKLDILYQFPNLFPGTRTVIVLKQPKTRGSVRDVEVPSSVMDALAVLKRMQDQMKADLGSDGYMDYNLVICQANGRPLMTEHLNKRFKEVLREIDDPDINPEEIVFHSLRHTSASTKLTLSNGDYNSVKHAGGWANLEMLTRRYGSHSFESDRERLAQKMDDFLTAKPGTAPQQAPPLPSDAEEALKALAQTNPELLIKIAQSVQSANMT